MIKILVFMSILVLPLLTNCVSRPAAEDTAVSTQSTISEMRSEEPLNTPTVSAQPTISATPTEQPLMTPDGPSLQPETAVETIPLAGNIDSPRAEISGMAWYGDWLILLPQYPTFSSAGGDGIIFALPRADILAFLDGEMDDPLQPLEVALVAPGLSRSIPGYEGFEAIVFDGDRAYLTIEASPGTGMTGHLVAGEMAEDLSQLVLDPEKITAIESASGLANKSDEAMLLFRDKLLTIHEANGRGVIDAPVVQIFDPNLVPSGTLPFPPIEYRITDGTDIDENGRFWVINYFYPGEPELLPQQDPITERYGQGASHAGRDGVERLLEFQMTESGVSLVERAPIQLELLPDELRNWEGIARLEDRGFLIATDKFPQTILGFVAYP